jgi:hypothetical protein
MSTVTVTASKNFRQFGAETSQAFTLEFSKLPARDFGPYSFTEAVRDLRVSALLEPLAARNLVLDAATSGTATTETGE